jgi:hypothetical protein
MRRRPGGRAPANSASALVERLGELHTGPEGGVLGALDLLFRSGFPVPSGFVVTEEGHRHFMRSTGLERALLESAGGADELRSRFCSCPVGGELGREISRALINLGAGRVVVPGTRHTGGGFSTIPSVLAAIRERWTSREGLSRQLLAARNGLLPPAWPVLVQRACRPGSTVMASAAGRSVSLDREPGSLEVRRLTLEAAALLGKPVRIRWALEHGRWLIAELELDPVG